MSNKKRLVIIIFIIFLTIPIVKETYKMLMRKNALSIYQIKNPDELKEENININDIQLENEPILTIDDITKFYWANTNVGNQPIENYSFQTKKYINFKSNNRGNNFLGVPFVLVVNGKRLYLGSFHFTGASFGPPPYIDIVIAYPPDINNQYYTRTNHLNGIDVRKNKSIYRVLKMYNKLYKEDSKNNYLIGYIINNFFSLFYIAATIFILFFCTIRYVVRTSIKKNNDELKKFIKEEILNTLNEYKEQD